MAVPEYNHSSSHLSYMLPRYDGSTAGGVQFVFGVMVACIAERFSAACKMAPVYQERLTVSKSDLEACLLIRLPTEIPAAAEAEGTYCCARINGFISSGQQLKTRLVGCVHSRSGRTMIHDTDKCTAVSSATPPVRNPYQSESIQLVLGMSFSWCLFGWPSKMVLRAAVAARYPERLPGIGTRKLAKKRTFFCGQTHVSSDAWKKLDMIDVNTAAAGSVESDQKRQFSRVTTSASHRGVEVLTKCGNVNIH